MSQIQPLPESPQSLYSFHQQPIQQQIHPTAQTLLIQKTILQSQSKKQTSTSNYLKRLYCQPCFKRGLVNEPMYVNLNEFQSNRYICEGCSFGQSYIIELGKNFKKDVVSTATGANNLISTSEKRSDKTQNQTEAKNQSNTQNPRQNLFQPTNQPTSQTSSSSQTYTPEFTRNIQINHNDISKYSISDISVYTENIIKEYADTLKVIDKYEEMVAQHIKKWRRQIKIQFEGVIGTFGNQMVTKFFDQLKKLEILENTLKNYEQQFQQREKKGQFKELQNKDIETQTQRSSDHQNMPQSSEEPTKQASNIFNQVYDSTKNQYQAQKQKVQTFVQILKMSGTRNLSNLDFLYRSCKGFSDAVQILVNLQQQETRRRFEFISRKVKVCSIETMYDADMINNGLLDNKIQRPPFFDEVLLGGQSSQGKLSSDRQAHKNRKNLRKVSRDEPRQCPQQKLIETPEPTILNSMSKPKQQQKIQTSLLTPDSSNFFQKSQTSPQTKKSLTQSSDSTCQQLKQQINAQYKLEITNAVLAEEAESFDKVRLAKINSQKPFSSGILNANKIARDQASLKEKERFRFRQGIQIDLDELDQDHQNVHNSQVIKQTPYPSMREYYSYEKHRNIHQSKLQLNSTNFERFPPPQVYLPSVESLTLKYAPDHIQPEQFLAQVSTSFRKLIELIIEDSKFATKNAIIMIAQVFPRLKSLVIRCQNEFDWELGKYFQRKMKNLVRFEVNSEKSE